MIDLGPTDNILQTAAECNCESGLCGSGLPWRTRFVLPFLSVVR